MNALQQRVALIEFPEDAPMRTVGLAWRRTSTRKNDFIALGHLIRSLKPGGRRPYNMVWQSSACAGVSALGCIRRPLATTVSAARMK